MLKHLQKSMAHKFSENMSVNQKKTFVKFFNLQGMMKESTEKKVDYMSSYSMKSMPFVDKEVLMVLLQVIL